MTRVFSAIVAVSVAVLLGSVVAACLWPHPPAATPTEDTDVAVSFRQNVGASPTAVQRPGYVEPVRLV